MALAADGSSKLEGGVLKIASSARFLDFSLNDIAMSNDLAPFSRFHLGIFFYIVLVS